VPCFLGTIPREYTTQMPYTCLRRYYTMLGRMHVDELVETLKALQCILDMFVEK
jgi:hypothetical protein